MELSALDTFERYATSEMIMVAWFDFVNLILSISLSPQLTNT